MTKRKEAYIDKSKFICIPLNKYVAKLNDISKIREKRLKLCIMLLHF